MGAAEDFNLSSYLTILWILELETNLREVWSFTYNRAFTWLKAPTLWHYDNRHARPFWSLRRWPNHNYSIITKVRFQLYWIQRKVQSWLCLCLGSYLTEENDHNQYWCQLRIQHCHNFWQEMRKENEKGNWEKNKINFLQQK